MIRVAGSIAKSWLARHLGVTFDRDYYFDPATRQAIDRRCNEYAARQLGDLSVFYTESNLGRREWYPGSPVLVGGIQPNMIIGMLLGAEFLPTVDADADISPRRLQGRRVEDLPKPTSLLAHPLVAQWDREIASLRADHADGPVIPPFFWDTSGRAAVHGSVTSGLKFFGDDFFLVMVAEPQQCETVLAWLTEVAAILVRHFAEVTGISLTGIHIGECVACMVDVDNFRRFIVPAASALGDQFGRVRFHSCGCSDHIIEACADIRGLASLDVGGETSLARIRQVFGPELPVGIAPLVEDMTTASTTGILQWFDRVREENAGGDLSIGYHIEADYNLDTIRALHAAVKQRV